MKKLALLLTAYLAFAGAQAFAQVIQQPSPPPGPIGCAYNSSPPTLSDGQAGMVQCSSAGALITNATITPSGTQDTNIKQVNGATVPVGHGVAATAMRVELPTDGTGTVGLIAGSAIVGKVGIDQTTDGTTNLVVAKQATAANLNATVVGNGTFATQAAPTATTAGGASFLNIAAGQATTTVKSGAGTLYAIVLNSAATATNTTTIYDNTAASGTVIGRPAVTGVTAPVTLDFGPTGLAFGTGLTIITATANGGDMTVVYK